MRGSGFFVLSALLVARGDSAAHGQGHLRAALQGDRVAPANPVPAGQAAGPVQGVAANALTWAIENPIWSLTLVCDVILIWVIVAIWRRQRELALEEAGDPAVGIGVEGARKRWRTLAALARLASSATPAATTGWRGSWESVIEARAQRKDSLRRERFDLFGVVMRAVGPVLQVVVLLIVSFEAHAFFTVALPGLGLGWWQRQAVGGAFAAVVTGLLASYASCALLDPGRPEATESCKAACSKCGGPKIPRSHHCRVCRRCVTEMDHHCPWINNCIGKRNIWCFRLFLLHASLASAAVAAPLVPILEPFGACLVHPDSGNLLTCLASGGDPLTTLHALTAFTIGVIVAGMLTPFFLFHCYLAYKGQTTIEHMQAEAEFYEKRRRAVALPKPSPSDVPLALPY